MNISIHLTKESTVSIKIFYLNIIIFILPIIEWPWDENEIMKNFRDWMFLPDPDSPPDAYKLLCKIS